MCVTLIQPTFYTWAPLESLIKGCVFYVLNNEWFKKLLCSLIDMTNKTTTVTLLLWHLSTACCICRERKLLAKMNLQKDLFYQELDEPQNTSPYVMR